MPEQPSHVGKGHPCPDQIDGVDVPEVVEPQWGQPGFSDSAPERAPVLPGQALRDPRQYTVRLAAIERNHPAAEEFLQKGCHSVGVRHIAGGLVLGLRHGDDPSGEVYVPPLEPQQFALTHARVQRQRDQWSQLLRAGAEEPILPTLA